MLNWWADLELNQDSADYESEALPLSYRPLCWCPWPESNRHAITTSDFKSDAATNYATGTNVFTSYG